MAAIRRATRLPDFRVFRNLPRVYFCSSMSSPPHPHASPGSLQTRSALGGTSRSGWQIGARGALFGMIVNLIFAMANILAGSFRHAYVLLADRLGLALHVGGALVSLGGMTVGWRQPD